MLNSQIQEVKSIALQLTSVPNMEGNVNVCEACIIFKWVTMKILLIKLPHDLGNS